jgi:23S rRNA pseudouridine1911/1915/1917 synthase
MDDKYLDIDAALEGESILEALSALIVNESKTRLRRLIAEGKVELNEHRVSPKTAVHEGDRVTLPGDLDLSQPPPQRMEFNVLQEDDAHVVIDKPPGVPVLPTRDGSDREFYDSLKAYVNRNSPPGGPYNRPHLVHRLDRETSGVLLVAKTTAASRQLSLQFQRRQVSKTYVGLIEGVLPRPEVVVKVPLSRSDDSILAMQPDEKSGKDAETKVSLERRFGHFCVVRLEPRTGRQHQLRVHLSAIGYPLAVDFLYGRRDQLTGASLNGILGRRAVDPQSVLLGRCPLHALSLRYRPPDSTETLEVRAPLPDDLTKVIETLERTDPPD